MRRTHIVMLVVMLAVSGVAYPVQSIADDNAIDRVSVLISKLRKTMSKLNEINKLEDVGVAHEDVVAMREAVEAKTNKMIKEIIKTIKDI